jgi:hypothetical protein
MRPKLNYVTESLHGVGPYIGIGLKETLKKAMSKRIGGFCET